MRGSFVIALIVAQLVVVGVFGQSSIEVDVSQATLTGFLRYRVFAVLSEEDSESLVLSVGGQDGEEDVQILTPDGVYNSEFNGTFSAQGLSSYFLSIFPDLADDSFGTIGLLGPAAEYPNELAQNPQLFIGEFNEIAHFFTENGATELNMKSETATEIGDFWGIDASQGCSNCIAIDNRVLLMQITTSGLLEGNIMYRLFRDYGQVVRGPFDLGEAIIELYGCTDIGACNFDESASIDSGNCDYSCCPGPGCCSGGTQWDQGIQKCVPTRSSDINGDGCTNLGDLLDLLSGYGTCEE